MTMTMPNRRQFIQRISSLGMLPFISRKRRSSFEEFKYVLLNPSVTHAYVSPEISKQLLEWLISEGHGPVYYNITHWKLANLQFMGKEVEIVEGWRGTEKWTCQIGKIMSVANGGSHE